MEAVKMITKYTALRDELKEKEGLVKRSVNNSVMQENVIMELRSFIDDLLWGPTNEPISFERIARKRRYKKGLNKVGKPALDIFLAKFRLYNSNVQDGLDNDDNEANELYL